MALLTRFHVMDSLGTSLGRRHSLLKSDIRREHYATLRGMLFSRYSTFWKEKLKVISVLWALRVAGLATEPTYGAAAHMVLLLYATHNGVVQVEHLDSSMSANGSLLDDGSRHRRSAIDDETSCRNNGCTSCAPTECSSLSTYLRSPTASWPQA